MSVEILRLDDLTIYESKFASEKELIVIKFRDIGGVTLDRNKAHLLKLWLEEHLK